ncbi:hypothetical protein KFE94_16785 [bacterium SCSIO 12643]|nr:hypothetical protein KFE94_16785 [bacterium SCSIO 12643]
MKSKIYQSLVLILLISFSCDRSYLGSDIEIFKECENWELAKAISNHKIEKARELLGKHPEWVDINEPKYGFSLLYWTFYNSLENSLQEDYFKESELLLMHGADPYFTTRDGTSPINRAAMVFHNNDEYIELCLKYSVNSNLSEDMVDKVLNESLLLACGNFRDQLEGVKVLLNAGANKNYFNSDSSKIPLSVSITMRNMGIAEFLLIDKKVDYDVYIYRSVDGKKMSVVDRLINKDFNDYRNVVIQKRMLEYIESHRTEN